MIRSDIEQKNKKHNDSLSLSCVVFDHLSVSLFSIRPQQKHITVLCCLVHDLPDRQFLQRHLWFRRWWGLLMFHWLHRRNQCFSPSTRTRPPSQTAMCTRRPDKLRRPNPQPRRSRLFPCNMLWEPFLLRTGEELGLLPGQSWWETRRRKSKR